MGTCKIIVHEFETGVKAEVTVDKWAIYGHTSGTLTVSHCEDSKKKMKLERPCHEDLEGCVVEVMCNHLFTVPHYPLAPFKRTLIHQCLPWAVEQKKTEIFVWTIELLVGNSFWINVQCSRSNNTGILAAMWPCGVVTFVRELFLAESKSQVYGHLHQYLQSNPVTASHLSKLYRVVVCPFIPCHYKLHVEYVCYDDGCHLKRYAINKCRSDQTQTSRIMSQLCIAIDRMHMVGHVDV